MYAVKYPLNDEYLYVIGEDNSPVLYDSIEEAASLADMWGDSAILVIVNIEEVLNRKGR